MKYQELLTAVQSAAGLRLRLRLQPMYGPGDVIFPPTVDKGQYQSSQRRLPGHGESVPCTLIDSVQSQANRMEEALLRDIHAGNIQLPHLVTDFTGVAGLKKKIGKITDLEAPHRVFDAIFRDSVKKDEEGKEKHFPFTKEGQDVIHADARNATPIFSISPVSLIFGSWDSTGISGGLGEKYTRCVVSELVAVNAEQQEVRAGTRIDPLNASGSVNPSNIQKATKDEIWAELAKSRKKIEKPSEINHSSVPWGADGKVHAGITCEYVQQSTTISFPALRELGFPVDNGKKSAAARTTLAAIALHAAVLNLERGWHLRSRCDLVLADNAAVEWELLDGKGGRFEVTADQTRNLLKDAIKEARAADLPWREGPLDLTPSKALQELVVQSQEAQQNKAADS